MNKQQSGIGVIEIIVAVVVLAVLLGAGYLFVQGMNNQSSNPDSKSSTESATMTQDDQEDGENHAEMMTGWQAYTSEKYGFAFKYPENWTVEVSTTENFENQPNAVVKNEAGEVVLGVYGYIGVGCEEPATGNEPTAKLTVVDTEVEVSKNCNSAWSWLTAESEDGSNLTITTWDFMGKPEEEDARMLLDSATGLTNITGSSSNESP